MPTTEYVTPEVARFNKQLASDKSGTLKSMVDLLENLSETKAAQIVFAPNEDTRNTLTALTRASRMTGIKTKRERYDDSDGRTIVAVFLEERSPKSRNRRRTPAATTETATGAASQTDPPADGPAHHTSDPNPSPPPASSGQDDSEQDSTSGMHRPAPDYARAQVSSL